MGLVGVAGAAAIALVVVLVGVAAPGRGTPAARSVTSTTGTQGNGLSISGTTVDLSPVPRGTPTTVTTGPVAVPTTRPPPTTTTIAPPTRIGAEGAYLEPPGYTAVRISDPSNCSADADGPQWSTTCGVAHSSGGDLMWVIESQAVPAGMAWRVYALRQRQGDQWVVTADVGDDTGQREWTAVHAAAVDVTGDGRQDLVFGFHVAGASQPLVVEVVSGPAGVNLHRVYVADGSLTFVPGQLDGWWLDDSGEPYHEELRYLSGAWRVVAQASADGVHPPSSV